MKIIEPKIYVEDYDGIKIMKRLERACRTCYKSENLITEDSYKHLLTNCLNRGHESILEHEKISIRMICDIGVYKDLTRHRFASFSIESTRYCNYGKDKFDNEIKFIKPVHIEEGTENYKIWEDTMKYIEKQYMEMGEKKGNTRSNENVTSTFNSCRSLHAQQTLREWRHILSLRCSKMTHPAVRQLLIPLLLKFKKDMPELFENVEYDEEFPKEKYAGLQVEE